MDVDADVEQLVEPGHGGVDLPLLVETHHLRVVDMELVAEHEDVLVHEHPPERRRVHGPPSSFHRRHDHHS